MKEILSILILSALPALALASNDHAGDHIKEGISQVGNEGAVGRPGDPAKVNRTIDITMDDTLRFTPNRIYVKAGDTVRFSLKNTGKITHEMVIGSKDELKEHAEMMRKMPDMKHTEVNMARLSPGQSGSIVWQFDKHGAVDFACLVPGHMEGAWWAL